ncbi:MAG: serine hydrolase domain-containing protein [bacterium]
MPRMIKWAGWLFILFVWILGVGAREAALAGTEPVPVEFQPIRELIQKRLVETGTPSLAVAVARDGQIVWEEAFGWADRENRVPAHEHTMYSLASISKPFTATALMILVERGQVDLDKPINEYLGDSPLTVHVGRAEEVTVRRVADHTSGLPTYYHFFYEDEPYRRPPMADTIRRFGHIVYAPGERYEYSNLGYGILEHLIAKVSGKSYEDFMRQEVFIPLGLTHTSVGIDPGLEKYAAVRYGDDQKPIPFYDFDHRGGSAVYSSAHDLVRFGLFHLKNHRPDQKTILPDAAIDRMQQPAEGRSYAIGWDIRKSGEYKFVNHGGGMGGVRTTLDFEPAQNIAVVVLANSSTGLVDEIRKTIFHVLFPEEKKETAEPPQPQKPEEKLFPDPALLGKWEGLVHTPDEQIPLTLEFQADGDAHAQLAGQLKTLLNEVSWKDGFLQGLMMGDVRMEDITRRPFLLRLTLKKRGDALNGALTSMSQPEGRVGNALSCWVELKKQGAAAGEKNIQ